MSCQLGKVCCCPSEIRCCLGALVFFRAKAVMLPESGFLSSLNFESQKASPRSLPGIPLDFHHFGPSGLDERGDISELLCEQLSIWQREGCRSTLWKEEAKAQGGIRISVLFWTEQRNLSNSQSIVSSYNPLLVCLVLISVCIFTI